MCSVDPVSLGVALGSAALGSAMQQQGQRQAQSAQRATMGAETARQNTFAAASRDRVGAATDRTGAQPTMAASEAATADRAAENRRVSALPAAGTEYLPGQGDASQLVRDEVDRQRGVAGAYVGQQGDARANLGGWGDALFGNRIEIGRSGQDVSTNAGFSRGSAGVLPMELSAARGQGQGWRTAGDLVTGAGLLAAPHAKTGWNWAFGAPGAMAATTAATRVGAGGRLAGPV
jgi:hypothetical protein